MIKPNIGWDRTPEMGANTHPALVAALVELALAAGARRVAVMDHTCNDAAPLLRAQRHRGGRARRPAPTSFT